MEDIVEKRSPAFSMPERFAQLNRMIMRDLNKNSHDPSFYLLSKDEIKKYLSNPCKFEKQLRYAVNYIYSASPHFRRLVQYFAGLSDLSYVVSPIKIDPKTVNAKSVSRNYRKVLNALSSMSIKTQFPKILTVCLRDDVFYGTMWVTTDNITIQQLPPDYCKISVVEGNVPNVTFDFSYFNSRPDMLPFFPEEFQEKYKNAYLKNSSNRWIELDSPTSFAIKYNSDILGYSVPPFAGILREIYDIEDYKQLKATKTAIENYALLSMQLPMNEDGEWLIDEGKAEKFWRNLDAVMPEEVGSVLTPMKIDKISFERSNTGDADTVSEAEQNLFTAAGVSSLLFNNEKASANALMLSIKADQSMTFGIVKSIEDMVNRYIQSQSYGKNFKVTFLDVSPYNRKEAGDAYLKAASYGLPTISLYSASQGLGQAELDTMSFLENDVLHLVDMFKPLRNSAQMSSSDTPDVDSSAGRPEKDSTELSETGEESRERGDDWG